MYAKKTHRVRRREKGQVDWNKGKVEESEGIVAKGQAQNQMGLSAIKINSDRRQLRQDKQLIILIIMNIVNYHLLLLLPSHFCRIMFDNNINK